MPHRALARSAFRRLLFWSVVLPVALMAALAVVLVWQVNRLRSNGRWVEQADAIIANLNRLEKLTVDQETGMRGFLSSNADEFLTPYNTSTNVIGGVFDQTEAMLSDQPEARRQLDEIKHSQEQWHAFAQQRIDMRRRNDMEALALDRALTGKHMMDAIRASYTRLLNDQLDSRASRAHQVDQSTLSAVVIACGATVLLGLFLGLAARGQMKWLTSTYERALADANELSASLEARVAERTNELSAANAQLGEANKELEAFAYSISHDLRAPMRHITGFADLVRKSPNSRTMDADDRENLDTIYDTAVLAGRMVDDLLAFSRVGRTQLRMAEVDVNALVKQSMAELAPETRGRSIEWKVESLQPTTGDAALLKMVFQNLLANAVKYSQKVEHARIEVSSQADGNGTTYVVRDNGVGFDMRYVHKLFGVFQRLHRSEEFEGTGIGLANVRRIIVRHGGQVRAEGIPGAGAAFFVHLPDRSATRSDSRPPVSEAASDPSTESSPAPATA